jgi:hypothetical protein
MPGTPAERLAEVWELTKEVWSFAEGKDAEQIYGLPLNRQSVVYFRNQDRTAAIYPASDAPVGAGPDDIRSQEPQKTSGV